MLSRRLPCEFERPQASGLNLHNSKCLPRTVPPCPAPSISHKIGSAGALKGTFIGRPPHRTRASCHRETYHTWHAYTTGPLLEEPALALYSDTVPPIHCRMHPLLASRAGNMVSPETAPCRDTRHTDIPASCRRPRTSKDSKHPCHSGAVQSSASRYS